MQKRNTYTEIEDFLSDESFQSWILLKIDEDGWEEWTLENRQRAKLVEDARHLLLAMKVPESALSHSDIHTALQTTWIKIAEKESQINFIKNSSGNFFKKYLLSGIAASIFFCLMSVWFYKNHFRYSDRRVFVCDWIFYLSGNIH